MIFLLRVGAFQISLGGVGATNAFVTKLNATGTLALYSTYLGGDTVDIGYGIAIDASGNAYVTGSTTSGNYPVTAGIFQGTLGGPGATNAFVTKLNATGTAPLVYSTYLGGTVVDVGHGIAVDALGNAYVTGSTTSADFPTILGSAQTTYGTNGDAFVTKLNATATAPLIYSTYLGGTDLDIGYGIGIDAAGNAYMAGYTASTDYPVLAAYQPTNLGLTNVIVTKLNTTGSARVYSTYLGGSGLSEARSIVVDPAGNVYLTGYTESPNYPLSGGAIQTVRLGSRDAFITLFNTAEMLLFIPPT